MQTPEHDKLMLVSEKSQAIGEFLGWLRNSKKIHLCSIGADGEYYPSFLNINKVLAEFFGIDYEELENEKRHILEKIRESVTKNE